MDFNDMYETKIIFHNKKGKNNFSLFYILFYLFFIFIPIIEPITLVNTIKK